MATTPETEAARKALEALKKIEILVTPDTDKKKHDESRKPKITSWLAGNREKQDLTEFKRGKKKKDAPKAHVFSEVDMHYSVYNDIIKPIVEAEQQGTPSPAADYKAAELLANMAQYKAASPQEAHDLITLIASQYKGDQVELVKYQRLLDDVQNRSGYIDERIEMEMATVKLLEDVARAGAIDNDTGMEMAKMVVETGGNIAREYLVDPKKMVSVYGQKLAESIRREARDKRTLYQDPKEMEELEKRVQRDEDLPQTDKDRLVSAIAEQKIHASGQQTDVVRGLQQEWQNNENEVAKQYQELNEKAHTKYESEAVYKQAKANNDAVPEMPKELKTFLEDLTAAVGLFDSNNKGQPIKPADMPLDSLRRQLVHLVQNNHLSDAEAGEFNQLLRRIQDRQRMVRSGERMSESYLLVGAGIKTEQAPAYILATNEDEFIRRLNEYRNVDDQRAFIEKFSADVKIMADDVLAVLESDRTQFADQLLNPLIHQRVYDEMVAGLNKVKNKLIEWEQEHDTAIMMPHKEFHMDPTGKIENFQYKETPINASKYLEVLNGWVKRERIWTRYNHNTRVMIGTNNFESWQKFAEYITTEDISKIFEDDPLLEIATALHEEYVWLRHGMEHWKAPMDVFVATRKNEEATVDMHVRQGLQRIRRPDGTPLSQKEIDRLVGMSWVAYSTLLTDLDVQLTSGAPLISGPTQQWGAIHMNPVITPVKRFHADMMTGYGDTGYYFMGVKVNSNERKFRFPAEEMYHAEKYMKGLDSRERDRIITFDEFEKGLPYIELVHDFMIMTGGWGTRMVAWRKEAVNQFEVYKPDGSLDYKETIKKTKVANPQWANSFITRWYGERKIQKAEAIELRRDVWEYVLKQIAPQAATILDRDLLYHKQLKNLKLVYGNETISLEKLLEHRIDSQLPGAPSGERHTDDPRLTELLLDSETVTRWLLSGKDDGFGGMQNLDVLGRDEVEWAKALFFNLDKLPQGMNQAQVLQRARRVRDFMLTIREKMADDIIWGKGSVEIPYVSDGKAFDENKKPFTKTKKIVPWQEAIHVRSFPGHYTVRRNIDWEKMGVRVLARILGDNNTLVEGYSSKYFPAHKKITTTWAQNPGKMKEAEFQPIRDAIQELGDNYITKVHGTASQIEVQASVQMNAYIFHELYMKWFGRGTLQRYLPFDLLSLPGIHKLFNYSSWAHRASASARAEIEPQQERLIIDRAVDAGQIAPSHGYLMDQNEWLGDFIDKQYPKLKIGKFLPKWRMPFYDFKKKKILGITVKVPYLKAKSPYNAARLMRSVGAENWNVALHVAINLAALIALLVIIAAFTKSKEDSEGKS